MQHPDLTPDAIIALLNLQPHPEGGAYCETFRDKAEPGQRAASTAIYYLLREGEQSHWHRVDATEIWHFYAGAPLELLQSADGTNQTRTFLGPDLANGQRPQGIVPTGHWQAARSTGDWTLVGCTVAPGFEFSGFEMAPPDWQPGL